MTCFEYPLKKSHKNLGQRYETSGSRVLDETALYVYFWIFYVQAFVTKVKEATLARITLTNGLNTLS